MATLTVNGRKVTVDDSFRGLSPEQQQATVEEIAKSLGPGVSTAEDVLKSGAAGLRQGVENLAGMWGDAAKTQGDVASWIAGKLGASPETQQTVQQVGSKLHPFGMVASTQDIQQNVTEPTLGQNYEPQTTAGKYARTVGEFAPSAAVSPGTALQKASMAVVPAIASEAAGQLTEGTNYEPYARVAGALAGGLATTGRSPSAAKVAAKEAPSAETLKSTVDTAYQTLRDVGISYDPRAYAMSIQGMADDLVKSGFRRSNASDAFSLVDDLSKEFATTRNFDDINALVSSIGETARDLRKQGKGSAAKAVEIVRDRLMNLEETAPITSRIPLDRGRLNEVRGKVRELALRNIKERVLQEVMDNADTYQGGIDVGIRNGISNLLRSKRGQQMFKGEERKALLEVAQGRKSAQTLAKFGLSLTSGSGNSAFLPALGGIATGGVSLVAGGAAKELAPFFTGRALETAKAAIRSGKLRDNSALNEAAAKQIQANIRRLLAGQAALQGGN